MPSEPEPEGGGRAGWEYNKTWHTMATSSSFSRKVWKILQKGGNHTTYKGQANDL